MCVILNCVIYVTQYIDVLFTCKCVIVTHKSTNVHIFDTLHTQPPRALYTLAKCVIIIHNDISVHHPLQDSLCTLICLFAATAGVAGWRVEADKDSHHEAAVRTAV